MVRAQFGVDEGVPKAGSGDLGGQGMDRVLQLPSYGGGTGFAPGRFREAAQGAVGDALFAGGDAVGGAAVVDGGDLPEAGAGVGVQGGQQFGHPVHEPRCLARVPGEGVVQAAPVTSSTTAASAGRCVRVASV
ncbi:hypothetical protein [Streptomyces sp. NPDC050164]|uniref:hypothetical protein n=1 Tax=Streptomyces sp. NPDC050164 TaxID=3365605 RepID=UPI0037AC4563